MTATNIKIERFFEQTEMSFNLISTNRKCILDTPIVTVQKIEDNEFFLSSCDFTNDIEKTFKNEDSADLYAMKILLKEKKYRTS